jgi:hypothetical protein
MAVTHPEQDRELRSRRPARERRQSGRRGGHSEAEAARRSEAQAPDEPRTRESEAESAKPKRWRQTARFAGAFVLFLILIVYFVWIASEMGAHTQAGAVEFGAIFGAIFLGVVSLLAGGALGGRGH